MVIRRDAQEGRAIKILVGVSIALVLADVAAYLFLIRAQGGAAPSDALLMAIVLTLSLLDRPRLVAMRPVLRTAAAAGLLCSVFACFWPTIGAIKLRPP